MTPEDKVWNTLRKSMCDYCDYDEKFTIQINKDHHLPNGISQECYWIHKMPKESKKYCFASPIRYREEEIREMLDTTLRNAFYIGADWIREEFGKCLDNKMTLSSAFSELMHTRIDYEYNEAIKDRIEEL